MPALLLAFTLFNRGAEEAYVVRSKIITFDQCKQNKVLIFSLILAVK